MIKFRLYLVFVALLYSSNIFSQIPVDRLVGYWNFNDNFDDSSGNENHAVPNGCSFANDRFNNPNSAVEFDGIDDIIRVFHSDSLNLDAFLDDFTISFWYRSTDPVITSSSARFLDKWDGITTTPYPFLITIYDDSIKAPVYDTYSTSSPRISGVFDDNWYNYVFVNNIGNDSLYVYLNGTLMDKVKNNTILPTANSEILTFGNNSLENRPYAGRMDEIRIYRRVLNMDEISEIYNETMAVVEFNQKQEIVIYPNPVFDKFSINSTNFFRIVNVEILNKIGQTIFETRVSKEIDMSNFPEGLYFVRVSTEKQSIVRKVIKL